ncbi:MAG: guanylate kinase [Luminiphilus sp.]|nr:guanylate kinase [Luminiphilus sp.]
MNIQPSRGQLLIISAPSGAGKTSLIEALVEADERVEVSVSHTTRPMRPRERHGINYYFVSESAFMSLREAGAFFEWAEVFGNFYGTEIAQLEARLADGADVILEIDWQGAQQVRRLLPDSAWAFILPPSVEALKARLQHRGQDNDDTIDVRMRAARNEISHWEEADYLIINDDFDTALSELRAIVHSLRLRTSQQRIVLNELIRTLLAE